MFGFMFRQQLDNGSAGIVQIETTILDVCQVVNLGSPLAQFLGHVGHCFAFLVRFFSNGLENVEQFFAFYVPYILFTNHREQMNFKLPKHLITVIIGCSALFAGMKAKRDFLEGVFIVKNSWNKYNKFGGYFYASYPYMALKTMDIMVHKNAIPKAIRKKLGMN